MFIARESTKHCVARTSILVMVVDRDTLGGTGRRRRWLDEAKGKSTTTTLSSAAMNVAANAQCFSWPMHAARSSALEKVITDVGEALRERSPATTHKVEELFTTGDT